jgi:hypothetical protein
VTRAAALVLVLFILLTLPIATLAHDTASVIFQPQRLGAVLNQSLIASGFLKELFLDVVPQADFFRDAGSDDDEFARAFQHLTAGDWELILELILPPEWFERQIAQSVNAMVEWIDSDRPVPHLAVDTQPIKERLLREGIPEILEIVIDSWPACTQEQIGQMRSHIVSTGEVPLLYCEPPEPQRTEIVENARVLMQQIVRDWPAAVPLVELGARDELADLQPLKEQVRLLRAVSSYGWLLPVAAFGLIMALVIRSARELARWWGIPLLLSGLMTLSLVFVLIRVTDRLVPRFMSGDGALTPDALEQVALVSLGSIRAEIGGLMGLHAVLMLILGLVFVLVGWLVGRRRPADQVGAAGSSDQLPDPAGSPPGSTGAPSPPPVKPLARSGSQEIPEDDPPSGLFG